MTTMSSSVILQVITAIIIIYIGGETMVKKSDIVLSFLFLIFIFVFGILFIALPDADFSESENRILAKAPEVSLKSVFDGSFEVGFENYLTDQFPFRDFWVRSNTAVSIYALGKKDINGVYLGKDGYLFEKFENIGKDRMQKQIDALTAFSQRLSAPVYFAIAPNSIAIFSDKLPAFAPAEKEYDGEILSNQRKYINLFYSSLPDTVTTVDLASALEKHKDEYIYYRTDHHWTTLGAFYAYEKICEALCVAQNSVDDYTVTPVSDSFYGTLFSKGNFPVSPDTITRFDINTPVNYTVVSDGEEKPSLYDESFLEKKDKYSYFMSGNPAHLTVNTEAGTGKTAVFIKDSYTHCLLPFFLPYFDTIHMIDPRYINANLTDYVSELSPDCVIVIYNAKTLSEDTSFIKLGYTPRGSAAE